MEDRHTNRSPQDSEGESSAPSGKRPWQEPRLDFVEPKLTKHGELTEVTSGFFCVFQPPG